MSPSADHHEPIPTDGRSYNVELGSQFCSRTSSRRLTDAAVVVASAGDHPTKNAEIPSHKGDPAAVVMNELLVKPSNLVAGVAVGLLPVEQELVTLTESTDFIPPVSMTENPCWNTAAVTSPSAA